MLYELITSLGFSQKIGFVFSLLPVSAYSFLRWHTFEYADVLILSLSLMLFMYGFYVRKIKHYSYVLASLLSIWLLLIKNSFSQFHDIIFMALALELCAVFFLGNDILKTSKYLRIKSNYMLLTVFFGFCILAITKAELSVSTTGEAVSANNVLLGLTQVFVVWIIGGLGPVRINKNLNQLAKPFVGKCYLFLKLIVFPFLLMQMSKDFFALENYAVNKYFFIAFFLVLTAYYIFNLFIDGFKLDSYQLALYNVVSVSLLYASLAQITDGVFLLFLLVNYCLFLMTTSVFIKNKKDLFKLVYLSTPLSPFFYLKMYYITTEFYAFNLMLMPAFLLFLFFPLFIFPLVEANEVKLE